MKEYLTIVFILTTLIFLFICFKSRNQIKIEQEHDNHDDWIIKGEIPCDYDTVYYVDVHSLSLIDFINFSIDVNTKVTFDEKENIHFLMFDGYLYVYNPGVQGSTCENE